MNRKLDKVMQGLNQQSRFIQQDNDNDELALEQSAQEKQQNSEQGQASPQNNVGNLLGQSDKSGKSPQKKRNRQSQQNNQNNENDQGLLESGKKAVGNLFNRGGTSAKQGDNASKKGVKSVGDTFNKVKKGGNNTVDKQKQKETTSESNAQGGKNEGIYDEKKSEEKDEEKEAQEESNGESSEENVGAGKDGGAVETEQEAIEEGKDLEKADKEAKEEAKGDKDGEDSNEKFEGTEAYQNLIKKIYFYADEFMHQQESPARRKLKAGVLSKSFPKSRRDLLEKDKKKKRSEGRLTKYLHDPSRFCVYPFFEINIMKYCDQQFMQYTPKRALECKHLHCVNCCIQLHFVYKYVIGKSIVSEVLQLADDAGFVKVKNYFTAAKLNQCRKNCQTAYKVEMPVIIPPAERNKDLGKSEQMPATSCMDIREFGDENSNSDIYFITTGGPTFKIFCDMVSDNGGWGLFYNYIHHPYQVYNVDGTKLPEKIKTDSSHQHLAEIGFTEKDVNELLFWCTTSHKVDKKQIYVMFKSKNPDLMKVAMTGDQITLKPKSWVDGMQSLEPDNPDYDEFVNRKITDNVEETPRKGDGGFWNRPFGNQKGKWNIRGATQTALFECGDTLNELDGTKYETEHRVFFRGNPPKEDFAKQRAMELVENNE